MPKTIKLHQEAREKLLEGTKIASEVVGSTLGPLGNNVTIDRGFDVWTIHDGVNVFKQIELKDELANVGVRMLREAANKQVSEVGDGTTVVTILGNALLQESHKVIAAGTNAMTLRKGLENGQRKLLAEIDTYSYPVKTREDKIAIATISAEDETLGKMVGETIDKIGEHGIITVDESKSNQTYIDVIEGMQFEGGYISPYFVTDPNRMEATVQDAYVLITDMNLSNIQEVVNFLGNELGKISKNLVIIAQDVTDSALASFIATKINGGMNILCVKAPYVGQKQKDFLQDIAVLTGATVLSEDAGNRFDRLTLDMLGKAQRVTSTQDATLIVGGDGDPEVIKERIVSIRAQLERNEGTDFEIEKLRERIGKLTNGIAVLYVGGDTEAEMKERKERALDAIASTQAAVEDGIVAGGEMIYFNIRGCLDRKDPAENILYKSLAEPFKRLIDNAGLDAFDIAPLLVDRHPKKGIDVTSGQIVDLVEAGIIDAAKISKCAIKNAVSIAIQIMTTDSLIVPEKEEKK